MIHSTLTVGSVGGIRIRVHASTILLALLPFLEPDADPAAGLASIGLLLATLVVHELGHAVAARLRGIEVTEVVFLPIGGFTRVRTEPGDWRSELVVAAGGPIVNCAIAVVAFLFVRDEVLHGALLDPGLLSPTQEIFTARGFVLRALVANAVLGLVNLVPAWPADGGRILRAALVPAIGLVPATRVAAFLSQAISVVILAVSTRDPSLMLLASVLVFFFWRQASLEERRVRLLDSHRRALAARTPGGHSGAPQVVS